MKKRKKQVEDPQIVLDRFRPKKPRGRPGIHRGIVRNNADNYRFVLGQWWPTIGESLIHARTPGEVVSAFKDVPDAFRAQLVPSLAELILRVLRERRFPKTQEAQVHFLADSLGARGEVSPRRSRDICAEERGKVIHYIVRREFYIECTCGYKGPAQRGACPKCGTQRISIWQDSPRTTPFGL